MTEMQTIALGSCVRILDIRSKRESQYQIVPALEADPAEGRINIASPIARALLGKDRGEDVVVTTPGGKRHLRILEYS